MPTEIDPIDATIHQIRQYPDSVLLYAKESLSNKELFPLMDCLYRRFGRDRLDIAMLRCEDGVEKINPFSRGILAPASMTHPADIPRLWFGLVPRSVCLFIGETGAGKSSVLYNIFGRLARNEALWGLPPVVDRKIKTLYVDPENAGDFDSKDGGNCKRKLARMGLGDLAGTLDFHDGRDTDLSNPSDMMFLEELITNEEYECVVLDPLSNLFSLENENDNAQAAKLMRRIVALSRATNACIVLVHHTGKSDQTMYRGASAFLGAADTALLLRARGDSDDADDTWNGDHRERDDQVRLQIIKDRLSAFGKGSLYLQMAGQDIFVPSTFENWQAAKKYEKTGGDTEECKADLIFATADGWHYTRGVLVQQMTKEGYTSKAISAALTALCEEGTFDKIKKNSILYYRHIEAYKARKANEQGPKLASAKEVTTSDNTADWRE